MPLVYVQRYAPLVAVSGGTQYIIGGSFDLQTDMVFELDPTVFTQRGIYTLIDYSAGSFAYPGAYASGQAALNALATVDASALYGLTVSGPPYLVDDTASQKITVTLI